MITIDSSKTFQTMDGFGASITDSSAYVLTQLPKSQRDQVMRSVFSPTDGIGMSVLRQPIGSSDFVNGPHYTYNDLPPGHTDYQMTKFSIAHDQTQILPLLRQAIQLNPQLKVIASPWGQPGWMKTNQSSIGGKLIDDPAIYRAYALYLTKFVQAYEAAGVPIYALTVQNEPQNRTPDGYPGTAMSVGAESAVINQLGPMLSAAGLSRVKIIGYDHNWTEHPNDVATAARLGVPAEPNFPSDLLRSSAAKWISGVGYHCYSGDPSAMSTLHDAFPQKDIWTTECSGWRPNGDPVSKYFNDTLWWHANNVMIGSTRNWAKSVITFNLALNAEGGPANGGCGNDTNGKCTGVLEIDGSTVTRNAEYYTLGHLSKFVKAGAVRINSNTVGDLNTVAFRNPNNSIALVVSNSGGGSQTFGVALDGQFVSYTLPAGALATLTWNSAGTPPTSSATLTPSTTAPPSKTATINPAGWYHVINTNSGKCLDLKAWSAGNGAAVQQWPCSSPAAANQQWQFRPTSDGYYQVVNRHAATQAWDVTDGAGADGAKIQLWYYGGGASQQWKPVLLGAGSYSFAARNSAKCLDVRNVSTANGATMQQWSCTGGPAQAFKLVANG